MHGAIGNVVRATSATFADSGATRPRLVAQRVDALTLGFKLEPIASVRDELQER
jgi:hypothetical protein